MKKKYQLQQVQQSGFSLLEIMVVLALIAGIMALVVKQVAGKSEEARIEQARLEMAEIVGAVEIYRTKRRQLPGNIEELNISQKNDPWGAPYQLRVPGVTKAYEVVSLGADSREGGEGNDADIVL